MLEIKFLSLAEQVAQGIRNAIASGVLTQTLPGKNQLAAQLGVNVKTVVAAFKLLENDGWLEPLETGKNRRIIPAVVGSKKERLRVGLMLWSPSDRFWAPVLQLQHGLELAGHELVLPRQTLMDLKMDVNRMSRVVEKHPARAWVVFSAPEEVLKWFVASGLPAFAVYGQHLNLPMAAVGTAAGPMMGTITQNLLNLGHRRIIFMTRRQHRVPVMTSSVKVFLDKLEANGIPISPFFLPDWEETRDGLHQCLKALFRVSPPTAIIADEFVFYAAIRDFLATRKIRVPEDVSLFCKEAQTSFSWCVPTVAHARADVSRIVRPALRWVENIHKGKLDIRQTSFEIEYVPGDTIGRAPRS